MGQWFIKVGNREKGPIDDAQLIKLAKSGRITPQTQVRNGNRPFKLAGHVAGLEFAEPSAEKEQLAQSKPTKPKPPPELPVELAPPKSTKLKSCPACDGTVSREAVSCPHCGHPLVIQPQSREPRQRTPRRPKAKKSSSSVGGCGCLLLLGLMFVVCVSSQTGTNTSPTRSSSPSDNKAMAWVMTQSFVKKKLKSPSTADFGSLLGEYQSHEDNVSVIGHNQFRVKGWVDSQNAFGATIRTHFVCELENTSGETWRYTSLRFLE